MSNPDLTFMKTNGWENLNQTLPAIAVKYNGNQLITSRQELARLLSEGAHIYDSTWTTIQTIPAFSIQGERSTTTSTYVNAASDKVILVDCTAGVVTVTLPTALGASMQEFRVKDWKGQSGTNNITVATSLSQLVDGASTYTISTNYQSVRFLSDGANWFSS